jgi:hypothetical protein|eukprot:SAG25_NODE_299_length_10186_cov_64.813621_12_plen_104_part_00
MQLQKVRWATNFTASLSSVASHHCSLMLLGGRGLVRQDGASAERRPQSAGAVVSSGRLTGRKYAGARTRLDVEAARRSHSRPQSAVRNGNLLPWPAMPAVPPR